LPRLIPALGSLAAFPLHALGFCRASLLLRFPLTPRVLLPRIRHAERAVIVYEKQAVVGLHIILGKGKLFYNWKSFSYLYKRDWF
jgi:hypothetical protein